MLNNQNPLLNLAMQLKSAAINTSGTQVLPYQIVPSAASGLYEPNDANALYSQLSNARVDALYNMTLGNDTNPGNSGSDLKPYAGVLNQGFNTVNWATTRSQSPIGAPTVPAGSVKAASFYPKAASALVEAGYDPDTADEQYLANLEAEIDNQPSQEAWDTGMFQDERLVPTVGEYEEVKENAYKSASIVGHNLLASMLNEGVIDAAFADIPGVSDYLASKLQLV